MILKQVERYNREEMQRYNKNIEEWKKENNFNPRPSLAFYGFRNGDQEFFTRGWVVSGYEGEDSHHYFKNHQLATDFMEKQYNK